MDSYTYEQPNWLDKKTPEWCHKQLADFCVRYKIPLHCRLNNTGCTFEQFVKDETSRSTPRKGLTLSYTP
jgi:hypothetical protein